MQSSNDITRLIEEANIALDNLDAQEFLSIGLACVEASVPPIKLAQLAIKARQRGLADCGRQLLEQYRATGSKPDEAIYVELAFQKRLAGLHDEAAELFSAAAALPNSRFSTKLNEIHMLFSAGSFDRARSLIASVTTISSSQYQLLHSMSEFGNYLESFPKQYSERKFSVIRSSERWLDHDQVSRKILDAIESKSAFSLIRLGDGEGAFLRIDKDDERSYQNLYDANRQNRMAMWFGSQFDWRKNGFFEETQNLHKSIQTSDIVAIPDLAWLGNGYSISSQSGIPSLVNIMRLFSNPTQLPEDLNFTKATIAKDLHLHGYFEVILRAIKRVTIISCLPDLPNLMRGYFGIKDVTFLQIPGEQGSREALGGQVDFSTHYPEIYRQVQNALDKPWRGEVVLIAGGILGKLYASNIKQHGGIALDIGSLADRWLGKKTRPGDDPRFKLDL
ncbi:GT-D fold domain-containing protein [Acidisoma cladoniae]|uniref:GT-D fold domain-containing protein n=1 Tax=Acidisoma cladoniae TaxID=3040935 RepID=UPI00254A4487|nr:hypothetical protein [Acidisoma sp. PAMC 29798]